jgi:hypothetical protein
MRAKNQKHRCLVIDFFDYPQDDRTVTKPSSSRSEIRTFADSEHTFDDSPKSDGFIDRHRKAAFLTLAGLILCIYSFPALRVALTTRSLRLPAITAPDLGLYLSISNLEKSGEGAIWNSYYHIDVPYPVSYLKFRFGPACFGLLNNLFGNRIGIALFIWNLLWWFLLCMASMWLLNRFLPVPDYGLVLAGVALLAVFDFDGVWHAVKALISFSSTWPGGGGLPYIRPFTPQVIVPLWLCYIGLQIRALSRKKLEAWGIMAILQFVAFTAFPYATLMMAGTTAVAVVWFLFAGNGRSHYRVLLGFFLACALSDTAFALHGSGGYRLSFPGQAPLFRFQPYLIGPVIGKVWIVIAALVVVTALTPRLRPEAKWTLVGLGLTNIILALGDSVVSERIFLLSNHISYFYESTFLILFLFLISAYWPGDAQWHRLAQVASLATVLLCCIYGFWAAERNYKYYLPLNEEKTDLVNWIGRGDISADDLVVTQFTNGFYDPCEWIPLLSKAEVLYCRNAQLTLTPEQNRDVQRLREVLNLFFDGKDHQWLESATQFEKLGLYGEVSSYRQPEERAARILALRQEMLPFFDKVERQDSSIQAFFRRFHRVWIIQNRSAPFVNSRLAFYFDVSDEYSKDNLMILSAVAK